MIDPDDYRVTEQDVQHGNKTSKWLGWLLIAVCVVASAYGFMSLVSYVIEYFKLLKR